MNWHALTPLGKITFIAVEIILLTIAALGFAGVI